MDILQILFSFSFSVSLICLFVRSSPSLSFYNRLFSLLAFSSPYYAPLLLFNDPLLLHSLFLFFSLLIFCSSSVRSCLPPAFFLHSLIKSMVVPKWAGWQGVCDHTGQMGTNGDKDGRDRKEFLFL